MACVLPLQRDSSVYKDKHRSHREPEGGGEGKASPLFRIFVVFPHRNTAIFVDVLFWTLAVGAYDVRAMMEVHESGGEGKEGLWRFSQVSRFFPGMLQL
jgi:hypothetical protein